MIPEGAIVSGFIYNIKDKGIAVWVSANVTKGKEWQIGGYQYEQASRVRSIKRRNFIFNADWKNFRTLLYTIIIAALAFAFDKNEAILFLVLFCAIIPIGRSETLGFMMKSIKYLQKI